VRSYPTATVHRNKFGLKNPRFDGRPPARRFTRDQVCGRHSVGVTGGDWAAKGIFSVKGPVATVARVQAATQTACLWAAPDLDLPRCAGETGSARPFARG